MVINKPVKINNSVQVGIFIGIILLMTNINALVDAVLHPDIPYFDLEHLIVGGVNGIVSTILFGLLLIHIHNLNTAMGQIKQLESVLAVCSNCKKIRKPGTDPIRLESWQTLEAYISERTDTAFSHGICPECANKLYPDYYRLD